VVGVVGSERNSCSKPPALIFISVSFCISKGMKSVYVSPTFPQGRLASGVMSLMEVRV
jgi:hypothetical protein